MAWMPSRSTMLYLNSLAIFEVNAHNHNAKYSIQCNRFLYAGERRSMPSFLFKRFARFASANIESMDFFFKMYFRWAIKLLDQKSCLKMNNSQRIHRLDIANLTYLNYLLKFIALRSRLFTLHNIWTYSIANQFENTEKMWRNGTFRREKSDSMHTTKLSNWNDCSLFFIIFFCVYTHDSRTMTMKSFALQSIMNTN